MLISTGEWEPDGEPDPHQVFLQAREDTAAGRYPEALAKRLWFHHHSLEWGPALFGVRLSYALQDWMELAALYPPALEALTAIRDSVANTFRAGNGSRDEFIDVVAINRALEQEARSVQLFLQLCEDQPELAASVFDIVRSALVRARAYELCARFLHPKQDLERALSLYRMNRKLAEDPKFGEHLRQTGELTFANEIATLAALLVVNGRKEEAQQIVSLAKQEWSDRKFEPLLQQALEGKVPDPLW